MSFTLEVTIAGLCVLVPDRVRKEMHVLMPDTRTGAHGCTDGHEARIYFDPKYVTGDSTAPDAKPKDWKCDEIYGGSLTLQGLGSELPVIPAEVLAVPAKVHADCLASDGGHRLDARITLSNLTYLVAEPGSIWDIPSVGERHLTFRAMWSMIVDGTSLKWNVASLGTANAPTTTELLPVYTPSGKLLKVMIVHGESAELPGSTTPYDEPAPGSPPKHIGKCLRTIFPSDKIPNVRYNRPVKNQHVCDLCSEQKEFFSTATTFSCMLTQGDMP